MTQIQRILHPTDFSEPAEGALRYALALAAELGAEVHLAHIYQLPVYAMPDGAMIATPELATQISEQANKEMTALLERAKREGVRVEGHLREGVSHVEIAEAAKELGAQLIVMGTHGRTGLSHLLLGSVAERVVRTSEVPVLTVPMAK